VLILILGSVLSCQSASPSASASKISRQEAESDYLVVRTGSLTLRVSDLDTAKAGVEEILARAGGRVQQSTSSERSSVWISARVPAYQLNETMNEIANLGRVDSRTVASEDVTRQHQDLVIRLKNARALRNRLRELLARAEGVEDVLAIEKELSRVQTEIESMDAQIKDLDSRIEFSRLSIHLKRKRVLGPLGLLGYGLWWGVEKLFVID